MLDMYDYEWSDGDDTYWEERPTGYWYSYHDPKTEYTFSISFKTMVPTRSLMYHTTCTWNSDGSEEFVEWCHTLQEAKELCEQWHLEYVRQV